MRGDVFADRIEAGQHLAARLQHLRGERPVVLGLPRGGVPVAAEVARTLGAPLDVIVVRKLGMPGQPELAMGAIGEEGAKVLNQQIAVLVSPQDIERVEQAERAELEQRVREWRSGRPGVDLDGRTVVIIDDGIATGATAAAPEAVVELGGVADEVVAVRTPAGFAAVGQWYADFTPTSNDEVTRLLAQLAP